MLCSQTWVLPSSVAAVLACSQLQSCRSWFTVGAVVDPWSHGPGEGQEACGAGKAVTGVFSLPG